jgi:hypothetical protein
MFRNAVAPEEHATMEQELADKKQRLQELKNRTLPHSRAEREMHDFDINQVEQEIADLKNKLSCL